MAALCLAACSGAPDGTPGPDPVALVSLGRAQTGPIEDRALLYGAAENGGPGRIILAAPTEAIVVAIDAPVGSAVAAGQIIVRLAPSPTSRLDLARAATEARVAEQAFARAQRLRADGLVSNAEVDTARAAATSSRATLVSLSGRSNSLALRAPGAGYVDTISASPGDVVAPGAAVATIARSGDIRARFGVDPALARRLRPGSPIRVSPAGGEAGFVVPILSVNPVVDPQTRLASVFARLPAAAGIGPGETLTGEALVSATGAALTIPYAALLDDGGQPFVFVVANGRAHRRDVAAGPTAGNRVAITRGLRPGEAVVVQGGTALQDGMKVRVR